MPSDKLIESVASEVSRIQSRLLEVESQIREISCSSEGYAESPSQYIQGSDDPDHNTNGSIVHSIERRPDADEIYLYGITGANQVVVTPTATQFGVSDPSANRYLVACRELNHDATPITRLVWADMTNTFPDVKVKCTATDTTSDYLYSKLAAGPYVTIDVLNCGGDEDVRISMDTTYLGNLYAPVSHTHIWNDISNAYDLNDAYKGWFVRENPAGDGIDFVDPTTVHCLDVYTKVSATDTTADFLFDKLSAGEGISLTIINGGGDEQVEISLALAGIYQVKRVADLSPDDNVLVQV